MVEKEFILRVIQMQMDWMAFCKKGAEIPLFFDEAVDLPFVDLTLDMMGFPQDNTTEMREKFGSGAIFRPETFSRDYFFQFFYDEVEGLTAEQIYEKLSEFLHGITTKEGEDLDA